MLSGPKSSPSGKRHALTNESPVVKQVGAVEVRIVAAAVLAAAADAVLVAHQAQNLVPILLPHGLLTK
jgi:hypothetical protein